MVDEPEHRAEIDASLRDVYETLFLTASPTCTKAALNLLGHDAGGRAPADRRGHRGGARRRCARCSSATACSPAPRGAPRERQAARTAPRRAGRDRQEHDRRRVRRADRRGRRRAALPDPGDGRHRPRAARLLLPARARGGDRGDRRSRTATRIISARCRGCCASSAATDTAAGVRRRADDRDGALEARGAQAARRRPERGRAGRRSISGRSRWRWCT